MTAVLQSGVFAIVVYVVGYVACWAVLYSVSATDFAKDADLTNTDRAASAYLATALAFIWPAVLIALLVWWGFRDPILAVLAHLEPKPKEPKT